MKIKEFINILKNYNPEYDIMISSESDLWTIDQESLREATLHEINDSIIVDSIEYDSSVDGPITKTTEAVLIDLDF